VLILSAHEFTTPLSTCVLRVEIVLLITTVISVWKKFVFSSSTPPLNCVNCVKTNKTKKNNTRLGSKKSDLSHIYLFL